MKKVYFLSRVDADKCVGDRFCEHVCPTGATHIGKAPEVGRKADEESLPMRLRQRGIDPEEN
jgi:formate hydrogenlyase subunit 6/NADH:ubiquinone oxidoreductase subunit I